MANRLVIRYYPVDGEYSPAQYNYGSFGLALWLQPESSSYDSTKPTMGITSEYPPDGALVAASATGGYWDGNHASVVYFPAGGLTPGQYVERELFLLEPDGVTVRPVERSTLPMEVYVTGPGPESETLDWNTGVRVGGVRGSAAYAGGAVEFGLYEDGAYSALASFWIDGEYFQAKQDGTSWGVPGLPENTDHVFWDNTTMALKATLLSPGPAPSFWVMLKQAQEIGYEPAPVPVPTYTHVLVAERDPSYPEVVGYSSDYGTLTPSDVDGYPLGYFATQGNGLDVTLQMSFDLTLTDGVMDVDIHGVGSVQIETWATNWYEVPFPEALEPGETYYVTISLQLG